MAGVLVARHGRLDRRHDFLALVGERHESGVEVDGTDAPAPLADGLADPFGGRDPVVQPDRPNEVDLRPGVVHGQVLRRNPAPLDRAGLARDDPKRHAVEERRRRGDHPEATLRRMRLVPPQRVVVAHAVAEAAHVVEVGLLAGPVRQHLADAFLVLRLEFVDGLDQIRHVVTCWSGWSTQSLTGRLDARAADADESRCLRH